MERLEEMLETIKECKSEFTDMDFDDVEEKVTEALRKEREAADWCFLYRIENGQATTLLFEGPRYLCELYGLNHPEYKGEAIQVQAY